VAARRNRTFERNRAFARTALLFKAAGILAVMLGVWSVAWGLQHIDEPPMRHAAHPYAASRQLGSIAGGLPLVLLGWVSYRHGRAIQSELELERRAPRESD